MLDQILSHKKVEVTKKQDLKSFAELEHDLMDARPIRDFYSALADKPIGVIAEIKYRSPSKGILRHDFDALAIAKIYAENSVRAISVLADNYFFGGSVETVRKIAHAPEINQPILFKDFIFSKYQIAEARASGADAVLLIKRLLSIIELEDLINYAHILGLAVLVETFSLEEINEAIDAGAEIIGINNRDLESFTVDLSKTRNLITHIPDHLIKVSESGLNTRAEINQMADLGFNAVLVGSAFMQSENIAEKVHDLVGLHQ